MYKTINVTLVYCNTTTPRHDFINGKLKAWNGTEPRPESIRNTWKAPSQNAGTFLQWDKILVLNISNNFPFSLGFNPLEDHNKDGTSLTFALLYLYINNFYIVDFL